MPVGLYHKQIVKPGVLNVIVGSWKYWPLAVSVTNPVLAVCGKLAALLPAHIPVVTVGGVADAVSAPSGTGALSPRKLAASNA